MTIQSRRPGDRRVRVGTARSQHYVLAPPNPIKRPWSAAATLLIGFLIAIAIGTVILTLPWAAASGTWTDPLTALFTATSAVCVTGLVVVDSGTYWSPFGQVVIMGLVQVGGFGFMTGSTFLLFLFLGRRTGLRDRLLAQASTGSTELGTVRVLVPRIALFTMVIEVVGALALATAFAADGEDPVTSAWWGIFHSIAAFNNAGFDLFGEFKSVIDYADDAWILGFIAVLTILGGLGFAIVGDAMLRRPGRRLAVETKLVLGATAVLIVVGALTIAFFEWTNPSTLGPMPVPERVLNATFLSVVLRSSGFTAVDIGGLAEATLFVSIALMFIGGASGSTAGGIKLNTFTVLFVSILSTLRGRPSAEAFGRRIEDQLVSRALAVALLAIAIVFAAALLLVVVAPDEGFGPLLFETVSAFGTVGLSTGMTPDLPALGQVILIGAMYLGRLGPLTFVLFLVARSRPAATRPAIERMRIG